MELGDICGNVHLAYKINKLQIIWNEQQKKGHNLEDRGNFRHLFIFYDISF